MARTTPVHTGYTIINGSGTGINGHRIQVWAEYTIVESSVQKNATHVAVYFYTALDPAYTSATRGTGLDATLKVGTDEGVSTKNGDYDFTSASNLHLLGIYSGFVPHQADGTGTVTISGSFTTVSSYISGGTLQATLTLPAIVRSSTVYATNAMIGQASVLGVSAPNPAYTHSIGYSFGELSGFLDEQGQPVEEEIILTKRSVYFRIPESFCYQIPLARSGICTLTCSTYLDGQLVGQPQATTFKVSVDEEDCAPRLSAVVEDTNPQTVALTGNSGYLVRNASDAQCTLTPEARYGAYIKAMYLNGYLISTDILNLKAPLPDQIHLEVEDTRGLKAACTAEPEKWIDYFPVTNLAQVRRDSPTAETATLELCGSFWNENFGAADNYLTLQYCLDSGDWQTAEPVWEFSEGRYTGQLVLNGLDYTRSYTLQVRVSDALTQAEKTLSIQRGIPVFDWGSEDFCFHVPVSAPSVQCPEWEDILRRLKNLEDTINGSN